jgi:hypothetical protein
MTTPTLLAHTPHKTTGTNRILAQLEGRSVASYGASGATSNYAKYVYGSLFLGGLVVAGWFFWAQWGGQQTNRHAADVNDASLTANVPGQYSATANTEMPVYDNLPDMTTAIIVDDPDREADTLVLRILKEESLDHSVEQTQKEETHNPFAKKGAATGKPSKSVASKTQRRPAKLSPQQIEAAQNRDIKVLESILLLEASESEKSSHAATEDEAREQNQTQNEAIVTESSDSTD